MRRPFGWALAKRKTKDEILIADSKMLSEEQRERAYAWIVENCAYGVGMSDAQDIDTHGILIATEKAMHIALGQLSTLVKPTYLLVDGCDAFWFDYPHSSVIRGDSLEPAIAAASIIAKVTRDRMMKEHAHTWPQYGFAGHKGYGSETHMEALKEHGPCPLHRQSFLKKFYARNGDSEISAQVMRRIEVSTRSAREALPQ